MEESLKQVLIIISVCFCEDSYLVWTAIMIFFFLFHLHLERFFHLFTFLNLQLGIFSFLLNEFLCKNLINSDIAFDLMAHSSSPLLNYTLESLRIQALANMHVYFKHKQKQKTCMKIIKKFCKKKWQEKNLQEFQTKNLQYISACGKYYSIKSTSRILFGQLNINLKSHECNLSCSLY